MAHKVPTKATQDQATSEAARRALEVTALLEVLGSSRRLLWVNFLSGLARGVGFFLGVSLVGGLLLGMAAIVFDKTASTFGFEDLSLKDVLRAVVVKFEEVRQKVEEVQPELAAKQHPPLDEPPPPGPGDG